MYISGKEKDNSKYVQLFDAIDEMEEFDDGALKKNIYGDEPIESRKYPGLKAYLYNLILKSLVSYDEKSSVDYKLKNMLLGVRSLFKRSQFAGCKDILKKAKKLAAEYEDFSALLELLDWEKKIAYTQTDIAFLDREMGRIEEEENGYLQQLRDISEYRNIFFRILVNIRKDVSRNKKQLSLLKGLVQNPLMADEEKANSFIAKILFHRIKSIYYFSSSQFHEFYEINKKLLALIEGNMRMLKEDVSEYISALSNHIVSCGILGKYGEVNETLRKLISVKPLTNDDAVKIHRQYYSNKFRLCIATGEFEAGRQELKRHLTYLSKFDARPFQKSDFYFQYFCIYFGSEEFEKALESLNEWLDMSKSIERKDLQSFARVLNMIVHYELGNTLLLESLFRSTSRHLGKGDKIIKLEKKIIGFILQAGKPISKKEQILLFKELKKDVEKIAALPSYNIFRMFDLMSWIDSKITGKPFSKVVKEKYRKNNTN